MIGRELNDLTHFQGARKLLVEELKSQGITDKKVLEAIENVPRHFFVSISYLNHAYKNRPLPIKAEQTISQPYTVAFQTQLLNVKEGDKILEIGTGSGYQATILAYLGAEVYTIERQKKLFEETNELLNSKNFKSFFKKTLKIKTFFGDGHIGLPKYSPFDKIIITAATKEIPNELILQLNEGGIIVAPVGKTNSYQVMTKIIKLKKSIQKEEHGTFVFVPMIKGISD